MLKEYFTQSDFYKDINKKNPIGMKGEIAISFGEIMKDVWSGSYSDIGPRDLKLKLAKYAPQFIGYNQHDSQEFLAFLLDGLHEDLNRIVEKPYVPVPDQDNMLEDLQAREFWNNHKKRNDSIIVDLFQGNYR
jgi:ubiquitin C-terminal hydrolase